MQLIFNHCSSNAKQVSEITLCLHCTGNHIHKRLEHVNYFDYKTKTTELNVTNNHSMILTSCSIIFISPKRTKTVAITFYITKTNLQKLYNERKTETSTTNNKTAPVTLRPLLRSEGGAPTSEVVPGVVSIAVTAVATIIRAFGDLNVVVVVVVEKELGIGIGSLLGHGGSRRRVGERGFWERFCEPGSEYLFSLRYFGV